MYTLDCDVGTFAIDRVSFLILPVLMNYFFDIRIYQIILNLDANSFQFYRASLSLYVLKHGYSFLISLPLSYF